MYKENVEITDWRGSHFVINKETIGHRLGNLDYTYFPKKATCSVKRSYPRRKTERIRFVSLDCYL